MNPPLGHEPIIRVVVPTEAVESVQAPEVSGLTDVFNSRHPHPR
jgi:hypothetical protein